MLSGYKLKRLQGERLQAQTAISSNGYKVKMLQDSLKCSPIRNYHSAPRGEIRFCPPKRLTEEALHLNLHFALGHFDQLRFSLPWFAVRSALHNCSLQSDLQLYVAVRFQL